MFASKSIAKLTRSLSHFRDDENGMETLQTVAVITVAALILLFAYKYVWGDASGGIKAWTMKIVGDVRGMDVSSE